MCVYDFQKSAFPIPGVLDLTGFGKRRIFVEKCLKISHKLHGRNRRHIKVQGKKSRNRQMSYFSPNANFNCPYLKIGQCDLFTVLLECITNAQWRSHRGSRGGRVPPLMAKKLPKNWEK